MHNKFEPGTIIEIDGADYRPLGYQDGRIHIVNVITGAAYVHPDAEGATGLLTEAEFDRLLECGRLVMRSPRSGDRTRLLNETSQMSILEASRLDPGVEKMLAQARMLDENGVPNGDKAIGRFFDRAWDETLTERFGPHDPPRTIRSWRAKRGRAGHRHARDMVRLNRVPGIRRTVKRADQQVLWKHAVQAWTAKTAVKDAHAEVDAEIRQINEGRHPTYPAPDQPYRVPSERTVRRAIDALESAATTAAKKGAAAVQQDWAGAGRPLTADFAFHRVIIDHTRLDLHVVDDEFEMVLGRPWLTLAIDVKTRAIVAHLITFVDPSAWTVGEILRRMALPKRVPAGMAELYPVLRKIRGKPVELVVDNAAEFRSHTLEAAARGAGFSVRFCPIESPRYRAVGERMMGTANREICRLLPGRVLAPREARRLGVDNADTACVLMSEVEPVANMVVAMINTTPNSGNGDRQPALVMEQELNRHGITNFADMQSFLIDTMDIVADAQLSPSGIRAFNLRYHDIVAVRGLLDDLVPLEGRRKRRDDATATVDFRYDPMDISRIHVWNRRRRVFVELRCSDERYADGMPLWFHEQIRAAAAKEREAFNTEEQRLAARARLVQAIRDISPDEKRKSREAVAKLLEIPRIRQITGNIVELSRVEAEPVSLDEFISCDRAALTSLDQEILSSRPAVKPRASRSNLRGRRREKEARDRRDAGLPSAASDAEEAPAARRPRPAAERGGFS